MFCSAAGMCSSVHCKIEETLSLSMVQYWVILWESSLRLGDWYPTFLHSLMKKYKDSCSCFTLCKIKRYRGEIMFIVPQLGSHCAVVQTRIFEIETSGFFFSHSIIFHLIVLYSPILETKVCNITLGSFLNI